MRASNLTLARESLWFVGTMAGFFAVFSGLLELGGGPSDPFDWIAALCLYGLLTFARIVFWFVKGGRAAN